MIAAGIVAAVGWALQGRRRWRAWRRRHAMVSRRRRRWRPAGADTIGLWPRSTAAIRSFS